MSVEQMRHVLSQQYGGAPKWVNKVKNMSDKQVMAIYFRMLSAGQIK